METDAHFSKHGKNGLIIKLQVVRSERKLLKAGSIQGDCRDDPRADRD